jgi:hypothetical protein
MNVDAVLLAIDILGDLSGLQVVAEIPQGASRPIVRLEESGGPDARSRGPNRLMKQDIQVDVWAESKGEARQIIGEVRDYLLAAPRIAGVRPAGVLTGARCTGPIWLPDEDWPTSDGRPSPRYVMTVSLTAHG